MYKMFNFECATCSAVFEEMVEGPEGVPEECPQCGKEAGFIKLLSAPTMPTKIIPSYPGCKARKAGYVHTHGKRPAEKGGSQVSMHTPRKTK